MKNYKRLVLAQKHRKKGRGGQTTPAGLNPALPGGDWPLNAFLGGQLPSA